MADSHHTIEIDGRAVPLRVRRNARARQLILRIDENTGGAVVTIPARTPIRDGVDMAQRRAGWIAAQLKRQPTPAPFVDGQSIPYLGVEHAVRHQPGARGIRREGETIIVAGRVEHLARRLTDWLKAQAKAEIVRRVQEKSALLGDAHPLRGEYGPPRAGCEPLRAGFEPLRAGRVTVRDTRSRWGSCAVDGQLNFSWRLILAPEFVLDYVVAHEVAHLAYRDHGPAFWALANSLTGRMSEAKAWLNAHGKSLHRYG
jgi:hypothetical protein